MHRVIQFDNILNVRDFGGHRVGENKDVVLGKLYRGAQLSSISPEEQKRFNDMGISLIVDLRYLPERKRQATPVSASFAPDIYEFDYTDDHTDPDKLAPHEAFAINELNTAADARRYMLGSYAERPTDNGFVGITSKSIKRMARNGENIYVHCAAGKDRTGTFAAIVLMLLGVSRDDIFHEYLRTNEAVDLDLIIPMVTLKMEKMYNRTFSQEALRPYFHVEPEYLKRSLEAIGDIENYAANILRLSGDDIENLRKHYIV